jgi:flagellar motility protein MotE (MotC chaperone)
MNEAKRRIFRFRLIPATILLCVLLIGVKVSDIVEGTQHLHQLTTNPAYAAAEQEKADARTPAKPAAETPAAKPEATEQAAAPTSEQKAEGGEPKIDLPGSEAPANAPVSIEDKREFNQVEIDLLQSLSKRREEIESWAEEVKLKENGLKATEVRLDQKMAELKALRVQMEALVTSYNEEESAKIRSLIKIYENMKPKDAARIFDELEMPTLLMVVDKMSERKAAPILANMSPIKAKDLTVQLAEQRKAEQAVVDGAKKQGKAAE